ncbi:hypothetical protein E2C01_034058 [Portunus trituberculatus]|uniref:Uncharacterized protein n=1 Tax=Portunus trituberculatus TaxID=210409 RepID=A0A5B7F5T1_PORTR|nr:hypothetical protein [Portunus trituberculatus]
MGEGLQDPLLPKSALGRDTDIPEGKNPDCQRKDKKGGKDSRNRMGIAVGVQLAASMSSSDSSPSTDRSKTRGHYSSKWKNDRRLSSGSKSVVSGGSHKRAGPAAATDPAVWGLVFYPRFWRLWLPFRRT